jgi:hypothetical protein
MEDAVDRRRMVWFIPAILAAMTIILFCYNLLFATVSPGSHPLMVFLGAVLGAVLVYILLILSARSGGLGQRDWQSWAKVAGSFVLLYSCSGYGISSAYMLLYEGPSILRDHIEVALRDFAQMRAVAERDLPVAEYEEMVKRVRSAQSGLMREIQSPSGENYCGVGPNAQRYIHEIARDLAGFSVLAGTARNHACSDTALMRRFTEEYGKDIDERLRNHPLVAQRNIAVRQKLLSDIQGYANYHADQLNRGGAKLSGIANLVFSYSLFGEVSTLLQRAASDYLGLYQRLQAINPPSADQLEPIIDISMLNRLVSGFEIPKVLLDRLNRAVTWIAFILPFCGDFVFVRYARRVLERYRRLLQLAQNITVGQTEVTYLWRPVPVKE